MIFIIIKIIINFIDKFNTKIASYRINCGFSDSFVEQSHLHEFLFKIYKKYKTNFVKTK